MLPTELATRYQVRAELGRGSFGVVYRVHDLEAGADRALKLLELQGDGAREAREIAVSLRLSHPHLLRFHDGGVLGRHAYLVMELADGSLEDVLDDGPRAWELLKQATSGVAVLHRAGLVHRDLKPENILLVGGSARVADLGLVRGGAHQTLTATGTIMGSPVWMAPEAARGERPTTASDVWALGVIAFQIVEGALPYPDLPMGELLARVARGQRDPLQRGRARLAPGGMAALDAARDPDPRGRPTDLEAWARELGELGDPAPAGADGERTQVLEDGRRDLTRAVTGSAPGPVPAKLTGSTRPLPAMSPAASAAPPLTPKRRSGLGPLAIGVVIALGVVIGVMSPGAAPPEPPSPTPEDPRAIAQRLRAVSLARNDALTRSYRSLTQHWVRDPGSSPWEIGREVPCKLVETYGSEDFLQRWRDHLQAVVDLVRAVAQTPEVELPDTPGLRVAGRDVVRVIASDLVNRRLKWNDPPKCMGTKGRSKPSDVYDELGSGNRPGVAEDRGLVRLLRELAGARRKLGAVDLPGGTRWRALQAQILLEMDALLAEAAARLAQVVPEAAAMAKGGGDPEEPFASKDLDVLLAALHGGSPGLPPDVAWATLRRVVDVLPCERRVALGQKLVEGIPPPGEGLYWQRSDLWTISVNAWLKCSGQEPKALRLAEAVVRPLLEEGGGGTRASPARMRELAEVWRNWVRDFPDRDDWPRLESAPPDLPAWQQLRGAIEERLQGMVHEVHEGLPGFDSGQVGAWRDTVELVRKRIEDERARSLILGSSDLSWDVRNFFEVFTGKLRALALALAQRQAAGTAGAVPESVSAARAALVSSAFEWIDGFDRGGELVFMPLGAPVPCRLVEGYSRKDWGDSWSRHWSNWVGLAAAAIEAEVEPRSLGVDLRLSGPRLAELVDSDLEDRPKESRTGGDCRERGGKEMRSGSDLAEAAAPLKVDLRYRRSLLVSGIEGALADLAELVRIAPPTWMDFLLPVVVRFEAILAERKEIRESGTVATGKLLEALRARPGGPDAAQGWYALTRWLGRVGDTQDCDLRLAAVDAAGDGLAQVDEVHSRVYLAEALLGRAMRDAASCSAGRPPGHGVTSLLEIMEAAGKDAPGEALTLAMRAFRSLYRKREKYHGALVGSAWAPVRARLRVLIEANLEAIARLPARTQQDYRALAEALDSLDDAFKPSDTERTVDAFKNPFSASKKVARALDSDAVAAPPQEWDEAESVDTESWRQRVKSGLKELLERGAGADGSLGY